MLGLVLLYDIRRNPKRVYADIRFPDLGNVVYIWYYIGGLCTGLMCRLSPISVTLQETTFLWTWVAGGERRNIGEIPKLCLGFPKVWLRCGAP